MEDRLWTEIKQAKKNHFYCIFLAAFYRNFLTAYNIIILSLSSIGVMGWTIWNKPIIAGYACSVIAVTTLLQQLQLHIIPSEKDIDKLDTVINFYFDYNNNLEQLWFDLFNDRITEQIAQDRFYEIKKSEKSINQLINEVVKIRYGFINKKAELKQQIILNQYLTVKTWQNHLNQFKDPKPK